MTNKNKITVFRKFFAIIKPSQPFYTNIGNFLHKKIKRMVSMFGQSFVFGMGMVRNGNGMGVDDKITI